VASENGGKKEKRSNKGEKKLKESSLSKGPYHCNSPLGFCGHTPLFSTSGDYCSLSLHKDTWVLACEIMFLGIRCAMLWVFGVQWWSAIIGFFYAMRVQ